MATSWIVDMEMHHPTPSSPTQPPNPHDVNINEAQFKRLDLQDKLKIIFSDQKYPHVGQLWSVITTPLVKQTLIELYHHSSLFDSDDTDSGKSSVSDDDRSHDPDNIDSSETPSEHDDHEGSITSYDPDKEDNDNFSDTDSNHKQTMADENKALRRRVKRLAYFLDLYENNIIEKQESLKELQEQYTQMADFYTEKIEQLQNEVNTLKEKNTELESEVVDIDTLKTQVKTLTTRNHTLRQQNAELDKILKKKDTELKSKVVDVDTLKKKNTELESKVIEIEQELRTSEDWIKMWKIHVNHMQEEIYRLQKVNHEQANKEEQMQAYIEQLEAKGEPDHMDGTKQNAEEIKEQTSRVMVHTQKPNPYLVQP